MSLPEVRAQLEAANAELDSSETESVELEQQFRSTLPCPIESLDASHFVGFTDEQRVLLGQVAAAKVRSRTILYRILKLIQEEREILNGIETSYLISQRKLLERCENILATQ